MSSGYLYADELLRCCQGKQMAGAEVQVLAGGAAFSRVGICKQPSAGLEIDNINVARNGI